MTQTPRLLIEPRSRAADLEAFEAEFAEFPTKVRRAPYRTALLPSAHARRLLAFPLPAPVEFFLARDAKSKQVLGRIGANVSPVHDGLGYAGFFEVDLSHPDALDTGRRLLDAACDWLKARGASRVAGPVDFNTWFTYRFRVDASAEDVAARSFAWEPVQPPEYPTLFEAAGMTVIQRYHSQGFATPGPGQPFPGSEGAKLAHDAALAAGFSFRSFDTTRLLEQELPLLHQLSHSGFEEAFLFEPIPLAAFSSLYALALQGYDSSPSRFILSPEKETIGFLFAFYDRGTLVVKTVAVLDAYRDRKLSTAVLHPALQDALARGCTAGVSALVKSGARSEHHENRHARSGAQAWRHDYALFGKDLK